MRKLKHIGDYLVVKFNAREMEEWGTTLGEYGVIDKELYTGNLDVDKGVLEFDGIYSIEEAIEQAKSLAFPEEPEQITTPPAPSRPHFPQIGEVLPSGYKVLSAYCVGEDRYVLAQCEQAPDPFVVWSIDEDGDTHTGRYFGTLERARQKFAELCSVTSCCDQLNSFHCNEYKEGIAMRFWEEFYKKLHILLAENQNIPLALEKRCLVTIHGIEIEDYHYIFTNYMNYIGDSVIVTANSKTLTITSLDGHILQKTNTPNPRILANLRV